MINQQVMHDVLTDRRVGVACCVVLGLLALLVKHLSAKKDKKNTDDEYLSTHIVPDVAFDLEKTLPPPFRAFRYAYKRHTIEVQKLDLNDWILLDNQFPRYHQAKVKRLEERGDKIVGTLPHAREAAWELCQELCENLSRRYPTVYQVERSSKDHEGWNNEGSITKIKIPSFNVQYDLTKEDPMTIAGLIQPCDLNILLPKEDGEYQLSAVMFGIGGGQRLKDKLGSGFADLHYNGHVPHYKEQLDKPLDRFLKKLKVESPIVRHTTALSIHDEFHWPTMTMGPEDDWDPAMRGPGIGTSSYGTWKPPGPVNNMGSLFFRQERQTLRRLPKSKALVWAVHTYISPLESILDDPGVPGRLASLIRSWDDTLAEHKGRHLYADFLLPILDQRHADQVAKGVCEDGQLPVKYPF